MSIGVDTRMTMSGSAAAGESRQSNVDGTEGELNTDGDQIGVRYRSSVISVPCGLTLSQS